MNKQEAIAAIDMSKMGDAEKEALIVLKKAASLLEPTDYSVESKNPKGSKCSYKFLTASDRDVIIKDIKP
jgi:hypothetical protein